jgi:hypothetical protein
MSFSIDDENNIEATRGDSLELLVFPKIKLDGKDTILILAQNDTIKFTVKADEYAENGLITKTANHIQQDKITGGILIKVLASETKALEYGTYKYDMQINLPAEQKVETFIGPAKFKVTAEISQ